LSLQVSQAMTPVIRIADPDQPEALALYRAAGYREIEPFGTYRHDLLSVFLERRLAP
jgi:hypothetical protein